MSVHSGTGERIWVTQFIDAVSPRVGRRPILVGFATLGMVPVVPTVVFFLLTDGAWSLEFLTAHVLAMLVPVIGAPAIWYWDARVYPQFVEKTAALASSPGAVRQLATRYKHSFTSQYLVFTVPWTALVVGLIALNVPYFQTLGVTGVGDPALWVYLGLGAWWGLITGIGFHGAITAIRVLRAVGQLELEIDPLHPDGLGGLSNVGYLAIWTTMLISLGSLTLPLAFLLGTDGGFRVLVFLAVGVYVVVIVVSFLYPTLYVNRRAQTIRERELEQRRTAIRELQQDATSLEQGTEEGAAMDEMAKRLEIQRLRDEYAEYADVNLYPLSIGILTRLVSSILLPIGFILFETFLSQFL